MTETYTPLNWSLSLSLSLYIYINTLVNKAYSIFDSQKKKKKKKSLLYF